MKEFARIATTVAVTFAVMLGVLWINPLRMSGSLLPGSPHWHGCTMQLVVDADPGQLRQVRSSADRFAADTGLQVSVLQGHRDTPADGEVLLTFGDHAGADGSLESYGEAVKVVSQGTVRSATISLSNDPALVGNPALLRYTVFHELGHVLGLTHEQAAHGDLMFPTVDPAMVRGPDADDAAMFAAQAAKGCPGRP